MKDNGKKILIYIRYIIPLFSHVIMFLMFFVPAYAFIVEGEAGDNMSLANFISAYWEKSRDVLFGTGEYTGSDEVFSKILFSMIIVFGIFFIISLAISIWTAIVALRVFLSDDEESAERGRKFFVVFIPNRIVAYILSSLGIFITIIPYFIELLSTLTGAGTVKMVLEAPDALSVGIILLIDCLVISIISSYFEKYMDVDIFKKDEQSDDKEEEDEDFLDEAD